LREREKTFEGIFLSFPQTPNLSLKPFFVIACDASDNDIKKFLKKKTGAGGESKNFFQKVFAVSPEILYYSWIIDL
jgi:hypothetical protein